MWWDGIEDGLKDGVFVAGSVEWAETVLYE